MSFPVAHSHTFAHGSLPQIRRKPVAATHAHRSFQRSGAAQPSLNPCSSLHGQELSCRQLPSRSRRFALQAAAEQAGGETGGEADGEPGRERGRGGGRGGGGDTGRGPGRDREQQEERVDDGFQERVVQVRRVTKVVKGGKQLSFR